MRHASLGLNGLTHGQGLWLPLVTNQVTVTPLAAMTISLASLPQLNIGFINVFRVTISSIFCVCVTGIHINNPIFLFCFAFFFFNNDCDGFWAQVLSHKMCILAARTVVGGKWSSTEATAWLHKIATGQPSESLITLDWSHQIPIKGPINNYNSCTHLQNNYISNPTTTDPSK